MDQHKGSDQHKSKARPAFELIAFDMDGTLLDSHKHVLPSSADAIGRAVAAGKVVAICSGRCPVMVYLNQEELPLVRYAICASGAVLLDLRQHRILQEIDFERPLIRSILDIVGDADVMYEIFSGEGFFLERACVENLERYSMSQYYDIYAGSGILVDSARDILRDESRSLYKVNVHCSSAELRERLAPQLRELPLEVCYSEHTSIELSAKGVNKGTGLLAFAELMGIDGAATIGVGDADNDLSMLEMAGLGVAMANGSPDALRTADVVTTLDNDHGGIAEAIDRFLLA